MQRNLICYSSKWNYYALDETPVTSIMIIYKKNFDILCMSCASRIPQDLRNQRNPAQETLIIITDNVVSVSASSSKDTIFKWKAGGTYLFVHCILVDNLCWKSQLLQLLQGTNVSHWPRQKARRSSRCFYAHIWETLWNFASCISIIIRLKFGSEKCCRPAMAEARTKQAKGGDKEVS